MLHKVCQKFLCNLHKVETTACAFVYGPANSRGVEAFLVQWSRKRLSYLSILFQIKTSRNELYVACMGCISGKKFFSMCDLFCSGHNNLETLFRFRITIYGKKIKWVLYPLYFFLILTFFFPLGGSSPHIALYKPCVAQLVALLLQLFAKLLKIPPRLAISLYSFLIFEHTKPIFKIFVFSFVHKY